MALHIGLLSAIFLDSTTSQQNAPQLRRVKEGEKLRNKRERLNGRSDRCGR
jgi:hypothetical protein